jgi:hypothetical protein
MYTDGCAYYQVFVMKRTCSTDSRLKPKDMPISTSGTRTKSGKKPITLPEKKLRQTRKTVKGRKGHQ